MNIKKIFLKITAFTIFLTPLTTATYSKPSPAIRKGLKLSRINKPNFNKNKLDELVLLMSRLKLATYLELELNSSPYLNQILNILQNLTYSHNLSLDDAIPRTIMMLYKDPNLDIQEIKNISANLNVKIYNYFKK